VLDEGVSQAAVEADAHGDILGVHRSNERFEALGRMMQPDSRMHVDVDDRKLRFSERVLGDPQHRLRPELVERQVAAVAPVERIFPTARPRGLLGPADRSGGCDGAYRRQKEESSGEKWPDDAGSSVHDERRVLKAGKENAVISPATTGSVLPGYEFRRHSTNGLRPHQTARAGKSRMLGSGKTGATDTSHPFSAGRADRCPRADDDDCPESRGVSAAATTSVLRLVDPSIGEQSL
jgi:hypothetical protein